VQGSPPRIEALVVQQVQIEVKEAVGVSLRQLELRRLIKVTRAKTKRGRSLPNRIKLLGRGYGGPFSSLFSLLDRCSVLFMISQPFKNSMKRKVIQYRTV
jgi:hypothetical protein